MAVQLINTHRKCLKCQVSTSDMDKERCECGAYMHVIGFVYQPTTQKHNSTVISKAS